MGPDALDVMGEGSAPTTATACEAVEEGACTLGDYVMGMGRRVACFWVWLRVMGFIAICYVLFAAR